MTADESGNRGQRISRDSVGVGWFSIGAKSRGMIARVPLFFANENGRVGMLSFLASLQDPAHSVPFGLGLPKLVLQRIPLHQRRLFQLVLDFFHLLDEAIQILGDHSNRHFLEPHETGGGLVIGEKGR